TTYEMWARTYPRDDVPPANLSILYSSVGDYDKALSAAHDSFKLTPDGVSYSNLCGTYLSVNNLAEAKPTAHDPPSHGLGSPYLHDQLYLIAFLKHDEATMAHELQEYAKGGYDDGALTEQAFTEAYHGRLTKARELNARAIDTALRADAKERAAVA